MKKYILFILIAAYCTGFLYSQQELFEKRELIHKGDTLPYQILFPVNYDKTQKYPLVLFLHGAGERGNDNESQLKHGSFLFTNNDNRADYPAIVIFPQCPDKGFWAPMERTQDSRIFPENPKPTSSMQLVERLVNTIRKQEAVDNNRIYILGISMGGMGTFDYICRCPKKFAAAIPICGGINTDRLKKVRRMPIRIYHGSADDVVSVEFSRNAFIELKALGSDKVEYIEFPGVKHNSWDNAFAEPDFLGWLFEKRK